jgi:hypothetical protein
MKIHEYQAKIACLRNSGCLFPWALPCWRRAVAAAAAEKIIQTTQNETVVVKAQIHAGGRGKGGGVKVVKGVAAAQEAGAKMFGKPLVTHQTGPPRPIVKRLLVEQGVSPSRASCTPRFWWIGRAAGGGHGVGGWRHGHRGGRGQVARKHPDGTRGSHGWAWRPSRRATWPTPWG